MAALRGLSKRASSHKEDGWIRMPKESIVVCVELLRDWKNGQTIQGFTALAGLALG